MQYWQGDESWDSDVSGNFATCNQVTQCVITYDSIIAGGSQSTSCTNDASRYNYIDQQEGNAGICFRCKLDNCDADDQYQVVADATGTLFKCYQNKWFRCDNPTLIQYTGECDITQCSNCCEVFEGSEHVCVE